MSYCSNDSGLSANQLFDDDIVFGVSDFFKVLSDPTRIKVLYALLAGEKCVSDLSLIIDMEQSAISHQLRILRQSDLVKYRKEGKAVFYALDDEHVANLLQQGLSHVKHKNGCDDVYDDFLCKNCKKSLLSSEEL